MQILGASGYETQICVKALNENKTQSSLAVKSLEVASNVNRNEKLEKLPARDRQSFQKSFQLMDKKLLQRERYQDGNIYKKLERFCVKTMI